MGPGAFGIIYIKSSASNLVDTHEQGRIFSLLGNVFKRQFKMTDYYLAQD